MEGVGGGREGGGGGCKKREGEQLGEGEWESGEGEGWRGKKGGESGKGRGGGGRREGAYHPTARRVCTMMPSISSMIQSQIESCDPSFRLVRQLCLDVQNFLLGDVCVEVIAFATLLTRSVVSASRSPRTTGSMGVWGPGIPDLN